MKNKLIYSDNLEALKSMEDESVDSVYIDPPLLAMNSMRLFGEVRWK